MANDFAGVVVKPGQTTDIIKTVDATPAPDKPAAPKPPENWDKMSYQHARKARNG